MILSAKFRLAKSGSCSILNRTSWALIKIRMGFKVVGPADYQNHIKNNDLRLLRLKKIPNKIKYLKMQLLRFFTHLAEADEETNPFVTAHFLSRSKGVDQNFFLLRCVRYSLLRT